MDGDRISLTRQASIIGFPIRSRIFPSHQSHAVVFKEHERQTRLRARFDIRLGCDMDTPETHTKDVLAETHPSSNISFSSHGSSSPDPEASASSDDSSIGVSSPGDFHIHSPQTTPTICKARINVRIPRMGKVKKSKRARPPSDISAQRRKVKAMLHFLQRTVENSENSRPRALPPAQKLTRYPIPAKQKATHPPVLPELPSIGSQSPPRNQSPPRDHTPFDHAHIFTGSPIRDGVPFPLMIDNSFTSGNEDDFDMLDGEGANAMDSELEDIDESDCGDAHGSDDNSTQGGRKRKVNAMARMHSRDRESSVEFDQDVDSAGSDASSIDLASHLESTNNTSTEKYNDSSSSSQNSSSSSSSDNAVSELDLDDIKTRNARGFQFYEYIGHAQLPIPPVETQGLRIGTFFVHKLNPSDEYYATVWTVSQVKGRNVWICCRAFDPHPDSAHFGKVLSLRAKKAPAWVAKKTATDYLKRDQTLPRPGKQ